MIILNQISKMMDVNDRPITKQVRVMKLILCNQILRSSQSQSFIPRSLLRLLALAGVVAGVNYYFQNFIADKENNKRQTQLINRVSYDKIVEDSFHSYNYKYSNSQECKKITIHGIKDDVGVQEYRGIGSFLDRGNEQCYIVVAPFTVERGKDLTTKCKVERKFVLNLGQIPIEKQKQDKFLKDPRQLVSMTTIVQGYVKIDKQREILNGLNNWKDQKFYKFIDLQWLTRLFKIPNEEEASTVYLERVTKVKEESELSELSQSKQQSNKPSRTQRKKSYLNNRKTQMQGNTFTIKSLSIIPSFNQLESGRKGQMQEPQIFAVIAQILHIQIFCTYKYLLCLIVRIEKERFLVLMPKGGEPL